MRRLDFENAQRAFLSASIRFRLSVAIDGASVCCAPTTGCPIGTLFEVVSTRKCTRGDGVASVTNLLVEDRYSGPEEAPCQLFGLQGIQTERPL